MARIIVKSPDKTAEKWTQRSQAATGAYKDGVSDPNVDWAAATAASADSYRDGVNAAMGRGAFANGVARAGNETWKTGAVKKGSERWSTGIAGAKPAFIDGYTAVADALSAVDLPPRRPKRDPANIQRVTAVVKALGDMKTRRQESRG